MIYTPSKQTAHLSMPSSFLTPFGRGPCDTWSGAAGGPARGRRLPCGEVDSGCRKDVPKVPDLVPQRPADQAAQKSGRGLEALRQAAMGSLCGPV